jgi:AraC-like DNA-binding protein
VTQAADANRILDSMQFIRDSHAEKLTIEALARQAAMSESHFAHRFRAVARVSPMRYLREVRPDRARELLTARRRISRLRSVKLSPCCAPSTTSASMRTDPLPSWNDGATKSAILDFVERVTRTDSPEFVMPEERTAVFDNDGTLWCEKPLPIQADFLLRRLEKKTKADPSLAAKQPYKAVVERDYAWLSGVITKHYRGDDSDLRVMSGALLDAYAGTTVEEFEGAAAAFLHSARHPELERAYLRCAYAPMIELLRYLAAKGFFNYLASGGGRDFMRPITEDLYGIPPERVIGSSVALEYRDGGAVATIVHKAELDIFDDGPEKPVRIWSRLGRRPIFAAGNSNGDIPMLHFCAHPTRPSLSLLLDHDDEHREYAYVEGAEESLRRARLERWTIVSLKNDWKTVFPS